MRNEGGAEVQSLGCPLLRDDGSATQEELAAVRQQLVTQFVAKDLDSDASPTWRALGNLGRSGLSTTFGLMTRDSSIFVKNVLAEQIKLLTNLTPLEEALNLFLSIATGKSFAGFVPDCWRQKSRSGRQLILVL